MHRTLVLATLFIALTAGTLHAAPPQCRVKGNDLQCDVMTKNGFLLDLHPNRPAVTFWLKRWRTHVPILPSAQYTITQESQRGTWYRFTDNMAWIPYPVETYFETWITDCEAGGERVPCASVLEYRASN